MLPITKLNDFKLDLSGLDSTQKAAVVSKAENILVRAPAGSGKTTCILSAVANYRYEHLNDRICAITFTRAATEEMKTRLDQMGIHDVAVSTIHSWAREQLLMFARKYDFRVEIIHEAEIRAILQVLVQDYLETHPKIRGVNLDILYSFVSGNKNMDVKDSFKRTLCALENRYIRYKRENHLYDYTDFPLYLFDVMNTFDETINSIDALFVDEYQDVDPIQFELFKKVNASKKFYCGDGWQCQPAGTKVAIRSKAGGLEKNIEDIQVGDPVVYYDQAMGRVSGDHLSSSSKIRRVTAVQEHDYCDADLITITTESGLQSSYTNNHRTFVRFNRFLDRAPYVVYLMCNDEYRFRIGIIPLYYIKSDRSNNSWRDKMHAEGCTRIWFLKICETDHEARVEEAHLSYLYGIPQTCWQTRKVKWTQEDLDYIYSDLDTFHRAIKCLKDHRLDIRYPLLDDNIDWMKKNHYTSNASSEIYAINIVPEYMSVICAGSDTSHKNLHGEKIIDVQKDFIAEPIKVYGLQVEGETYIADGIATHNCIYAFRGCDGEAFNKTADFEQFKLSYNYRSYQEIIDYAVTVYLAQREKASLEENCYITEVMWTGPSDITCARGHGGTVIVANPFGRVIKITKDGVSRVASLVNEFKEIMSDRPMILCRTNRQVKTINEAGYFEASTIHQAKGLEYTNVVVIDTTISCTEDLNIAYVALTRARDKMLVINWNQFELLFNMYMR